MAQTVLRLRSASGNAAHQTVQYMWRRFKFSDIDQNNSSRFSIAPVFMVLPANCVPLETYVRINTAFSSGDLIIGTTIVNGSTAGVTTNSVVSTQDVASGTTGMYVVDRFMGNYSTSDVPFYAYTATTGTGAGEADVWQAFMLAGPTT